MRSTQWLVRLITAATITSASLTASAAFAQLGLKVGHTWSSCHSTAQDLDHDGLLDACENGLAAAFAPGMQVQQDGVWDDGVVMNGIPYPARLGGDYAFAVQKDPGGTDSIRIAYLPAYYYDQGGHFSPHSGDSELILVDVAYNASSQRWETQRVFLSAHCNATVLGFPVDPDCRWWDRSYFQWVDGVTWGAPIVWVSVMKHANFYSQGKCSSWQELPDGCPAVEHFYRFPVVYTQQNIGSADYPLPWRFDGTPTRDCVPPFWNSGRLQQLNPHAYSGSYRECWWSLTSGGTSQKFTGWLNPFGTLATGYGLMLRHFAGFDNGQSVFPPPEGEGSNLSIYGTTNAPSNATCGYYVAVSGGTPPYTYEWQVNGVSTGDTESAINVPNSGYDYTIGVVVTDAAAWVRSASLEVTTFLAPAGTECLMAGE
ncbi:MAG TPA: hypothetical protein VF789_05135 [Thermoanaerobaculia bacterium]